MTSSFLRAYPPARPAPGPALWFPFRDNKLLVQDHGQQGLAFIQGGEELRELLSTQTVLYFGLFTGKPCLTCEISSELHLPDGWREVTLRELIGRIDDQLKDLAGYASQLLLWQRTSRYCPVCGTVMNDIAKSWGRHCSHCGYERYPVVSPAILALVHDGERLLLTHKPGWGKRYSCIAGFVEPGESLEECVQREVLEEVGLEVTDIVYVGSQPWPFPHQLMVGYTARYVSGTLQLDQDELDDAAWFHADALPEFPPSGSLAHELIKGWLTSQSARKKV